MRQTVIGAQTELRKTRSDFEIRINEVKNLTEMEEYTHVVNYPSLVIDEQLVCIGRIPKKEEVTQWLRQAIG